MSFDTLFFSTAHKSFLSQGLLPLHHPGPSSPHPLLLLACSPPLHGLVLGHSATEKTPHPASRNLANRSACPPVPLHRRSPSRRLAALLSAASRRTWCSGFEAVVPVQRKKAIPRVCLFVCLFIFIPNLRHTSYLFTP